MCDSLNGSEIDLFCWSLTDLFLILAIVDIGLKPGVYTSRDHIRDNFHQFFGALQSKGERVWDCAVRQSPSVLSVFLLKSRIYALC